MGSEDVFQVALRGRGGKQDVSGFFELANLPAVRYRLADGSLVTIRQEPEVEDCTGGIVWETAYLLATYLEERRMWKGVRVMDIGAGCGMLGLILAAAGADVTLTEVPQAMRNLRRNVDSYNSAAKGASHERPVARQLDWCSAADLAAFQGATFDVMVATDVVFSASLVEPLLRVMHAMSHRGTTIYMCMEERCPDAHARLMERAPLYFILHDETELLHNTPACSLAKELGIFLFRLDGRREDPPVVPAALEGGASPPSGATVEVRGEATGEEEGEKLGEAGGGDEEAEDEGEEDDEEEGDWRDTVFYWHGKLAEGAKGGAEWRGAWVGSTEGVPPPSDLGKGANTFVLKGPKGSAPGEYSTLSGPWTGTYKMDNDGTGQHRRHKDIEHHLHVWEDGRVAARGDTEFGKFVSYGRIRGGELLLCRQYLEDGDPRLAAATPLGRDPAPAGMEVLWRVPGGWGVGAVGGGKKKKNGGKRKRESDE